MFMDLGQCLKAVQSIRRQTGLIIIIIIIIINYSF
jgi:hypothetical protein